MFRTRDNNNSGARRPSTPKWTNPTNCAEISSFVKENNLILGTLLNRIGSESLRPKSLVQYPKGIIVLFSGFLNRALSRAQLVVVLKILKSTQN